MGIILVGYRFSEEGLEGLKNRPKSGRPPDIPREVLYEITNELSFRKEGWTTKQVEDLIVRKSGGIRYIIILTYTDSCTQVGIQTEGTKKSTCKYCIKRRERTF
jgi:hypothetical protein